MSSSQRPDSGIAMDFSEDSTDQGIGTPDTGFGIEFTRLGEPQTQYAHIYGNERDSIISPTNQELSQERDSKLLSQRKVNIEEISKVDNEERSAQSETNTADITAEPDKLTVQINIRKSLSRSYSAQLDSQAHNKNSQQLPRRRASTAVLTRSLSTYSGMEDSGSRPSSGMADRMRTRMQSYADAEGVQLRGDKGRARRKSTLSAASSHASHLPISNEWKKSFQVPYTPRHKPVKLIRSSIAPPKIGKIGSGEKDKDNDNDTKDERRSSLNERLWHQSSSQIRKHTTPKSRHVEIHYEDYLPKDHWLEMKPKKYTHNHKHGNHFELRKLDLKHRSNTNQSKLKKEAYVWENPHQIWLMEKTHVD